MLKIQINQNINLNEIIQFFLRIVINQLRFQCVSSFSWIFLERSIPIFAHVLTAPKKTRSFTKWHLVVSSSSMTVIIASVHCYVTEVNRN